MAEGRSPTVEDAASCAGVSRTTAYRYFPTQGALILGAHPETLQESLLPDPAPSDPQARLDVTMAAFTRTTLEWEPQLRAALRVSLEPGADQPLLRGGRAVRWIEAALEPLSLSHPHVDVHRLAVTIRSATGIESLIWLTDVGGVSRADAVAVLRSTARALLQAALSAPVQTG